MISEQHRNDISLVASINDRDDTEAKELLFSRYEGLLHGLARKYRSPLLPHNDAFQVAALGLMKAVRRFDPEKGQAFKAFAYPNVEGELKKYYRDKAETVRLPRSLQKLKRRLLLVEESFLKSIGREPTLREVASILGEAEEDVVEALAVVNNLAPLSLEGPLAGRESQDSLGESIGFEDEAFDEVENGILLTEAMKTLPPRLRRIAEMRLINGWTQKKIAQELRISQMHVSRLQRKALQRIGELCFSKQEISA